MSDVKSVRQGTKKMFDSLHDSTGPSGHAGVKRPSSLIPDVLAKGAAKRIKKTPKHVKPKTRKSKRDVEVDPVEADEPEVIVLPKKCVPKTGPSKKGTKKASHPKCISKNVASKRIAPTVLAPGKQSTTRKNPRKVVKQGTPSKEVPKVRESLPAGAYRHEGYNGVNFKVCINKYIN